MPLDPGTLDPPTGMTGAIYTQLKLTLLPPLEQLPTPLKPEDLEKIKYGWKQLSYALAGGIVGYLERPPTASDHADTYSSNAQDPTYWAWVSGFVGVFEAWNPAGGDTDVTLKSSLSAFLTANPVPTSLTGIVK